LIFGVSSHHAEHWFFMNGGRKFDSDVNKPQYADFYGPAVTIETEETESCS
jgi:alpha-L-fucosidase